MKYNKSEIMKAAWAIYRMAQKWVDKLNFSECLKRAWAKAKSEIAEATRFLTTQFVPATIQNKSVTIEINFDGAAITGNTYGVRELLKRYGCNWDGRAWTCDFATGREMMAKFAN